MNFLISSSLPKSWSWSWELGINAGFSCVWQGPTYLRVPADSQRARYPGSPTAENTTQNRKQRIQFHNTELAPQLQEENRKKSQDQI